MLNRRAFLASLAVGTASAVQAGREPWRVGDLAFVPEYEGTWRVVATADHTNGRTTVILQPDLRLPRRERSVLPRLGYSVAIMSEIGLLAISDPDRLSRLQRLHA